MNVGDGFDYRLWERLVSAGQLYIPDEPNRKPVNIQDQKRRGIARELAVTQVAGWLEMNGAKVLRVVRNRTEDLPGDPWNGGWADPDTVVICADEHVELSIGIIRFVRQLGYWIDNNTWRYGRPIYTVFTQSGG